VLSKYHRDAIEVSARLEILNTRQKRFAQHPTLSTRVSGVCKEIQELERHLPVLKATARWADELRDRATKE
jgi:hypothetical protein